MAEKDLIPLNKRTKDEQKAICSKAGIRSGESRRRKRDMRKIAQFILDGTFKDSTGNDISGEEIILKGLLDNLMSPKERNWSKAMDIIIELTNKEALQKQKAEIKLLQAKLNALSNGSALDVEDLTTLASILKDDNKNAND